MPNAAWVRAVCGRLKSDYRYSAGIVYNNFPWPQNPTEKQIQAIEQAAKTVLDTRAQYPGASLADLYDLLFMPPDLIKAHQKRVAKCRAGGWVLETGGQTAIYSRSCTEVVE